jgi:hypothetical protein
MSKAITKRSVDSYTDFLKSINVVFIAMTECEAKIDRAKYFKTEEMLSAKTETGLTKSHHKNGFDIWATITVRTIPAKDRKQDGSIKITASFLAHLHAKKAASKENIDRFVDSDFRILIWPYFREFVTSTSARMHIPHITLPITGAGE